MKKAFAAFLLVSALIIGFTMHVSETASFTGPDPLGSSVIESSAL